MTVIQLFLFFMGKRIIRGASPFLLCQVRILFMIPFPRKLLCGLMLSESVKNFYLEIWRLYRKSMNRRWLKKDPGI